MLFLATFALALVSQVYDGYRVLLAAVIFGPVLLLTILVHELGHCLASRKVLFVITDFCAHMRCTIHGLKFPHIKMAGGVSTSPGAEASPLHQRVTT